MIGFSWPDLVSRDPALENAWTNETFFFALCELGPANSLRRRDYCTH